MLKNKKTIGLIASTLIMLLLIIYMGPMDGFSHGYFPDKINCEQIASEDYLDYIVLESSDYEMIFSPQKSHLAGFEIYLINQPDGNTGNLIMTISEESGDEIDSITVDLSKVHAASWYKVYTEAKLKKDQNYILRFSADNCASVPYLQNVNGDYLSDESITGNVLISYAYAKPTFTFQNKIIFSMFVIAIWFFICGFFTEGNTKKYSRLVAAIVFMTSVLTWNYMYNSMDSQNEDFVEFQADSETLATGMIYAERNGGYFRGEDEVGYGLGKYYDLKGRLSEYDLTYISDTNWLNGYSRTEGAIIVHSNIYSKEVAVAGNSISFSNGETFQITNVEDYGNNIIIYLNSGKVLTSAKNGSLDDVTYFDADNNVMDRSRLTAYKSQYGLQGKVFKRMARYMDEEQAVANLNLICSIATAFVFTIIVLLILVKYNGIMAGCFFVTFWLSPWVVNFARNLYWVEFTWFIPMAVGLFCAWKINSRKCRIASYIMTFIAIMGKCLCGYEYITSVMMGLIAFMLIDFVLSIINSDKQKRDLLFRTILITGIVALMGFAVAICIHAILKGSGDIIEGVKIIFKDDFLRRTGGVDLNDYVWEGGSELYALTASKWETVCLYFHFSTEVITGIAGNLFPLLCMIPLCIFGYEIKQRKINVELLTMYIVFFLTTVSWFYLARDHSYEHTHMNYVLWYFGYVQICLYIIINKIIETFRNMKQKAYEGECCQ